VTPEIFAELLGIDSKDFPESCIDFIEKKDFRFNIANNAERRKRLHLP